MFEKTVYNKMSGDSRAKEVSPRGISGFTLPLGLRTSKSAELPKRTPPVLQEVGRLAAGVAAVATGSATGNPRNKCALQPGHSLMDWIRLGSSGRDLTGVGQKAGTLAITPRQLSEHMSSSDAWIAIRGRVYNITHYLPFHPGGPDELMRGAGKDATKMFDEIHAWVNYESILQKCYIGRLVAVEPEIDTSALLFGNGTSRKASIKNLPKTSTSLPNSPTKSEQEDDLFKPQPIKAAIVPRVLKFDWIQKTDSVTFIFYTKNYSNGQIEIVKENNLKIKIKFIYDNRTFINEIELTNAIKWPCRTNLNYETGKCEVIFLKNESKIWQNYGSIAQTNEECVVDCDLKNEYSIVDKIKVSHNTFLLLLRRTRDIIDVVPLGYHIRIHLNIKGQQHSRSYTPVPCALSKRFEPTAYSTDCLCLMVKSYPQGIVSSAVCSTTVGHSLELSPPIGGFKLSKLESKDRFLLIAAGTGITPMLGVLLFVLGRRNRRCHKVKLLFFNRTEKDILWKDQFDALAKEDERFIVEHVLSDSSDKWCGTKGKINKNILSASLSELEDPSNNKEAHHISICGPNPFTQLTAKFLGEMGYKNEELHCFLG